MVDLGKVLGKEMNLDDKNDSYLPMHKQELKNKLAKLTTTPLTEQEYTDNIGGWMWDVAKNEVHSAKLWDAMTPEEQSRAKAFQSTLASSDSSNFGTKLAEARRNDSESVLINKIAKTSTYSNQDNKDLIAKGSYGEFLKSYTSQQDPKIQ